MKASARGMVLGSRHLYSAGTALAPSLGAGYACASSASAAAASMPPDSGCVLTRAV